MAEKYINKSITEFLNDEYTEYTKYVIQQRCCPSLIDGMKVTARKIMHAAFVGTLKNGAEAKLLALQGDTFKESLFMHGDSSLNGGIISLTQPHHNLLNPLEAVGQIGSLRDPNAVSAPRYLHVKLSKYADILRTDKELLEYVFDEGQYLEPKYYLPIIPVLLTDISIGMAPGYHFSTMSYNPVEIIEACKEVLTSRKQKPLDNFVIHPYVRGIKKKNWKFEDGSWVNYGEFKWDEKKKHIIVTDLPYDVDYDGFEKLLNKLVENDDIKDWSNHSEDGNIYYIVDCKKGKWASTIKGKSANNKIQSKLKMRKVLPDDDLWVLDENKKVRHFNHMKALIEYFVNFRLTKYTDRKKRLVKILEERLKKNDELVRFIELVCKGKLKIRNRSKHDIKVDMDNYKLPMELISTPMSKVTIEERDELLKQNAAIRKELDYIKKTSEKQMYINDLNDLHKTLEKDFK